MRKEGGMRGRGRRLDSVMKVTMKGFNSPAPLTIASTLNMTKKKTQELMDWFTGLRDIKKILKRG